MFNKPQKNKDSITNFLSKIPGKYVVAATNNLGAHLSHRKIIYTIPEGVGKADVIAFLLNDKSAQPSLDAQIKMAESLKQNKNYLEIFKQDDCVVFKKQGIML